MEMANLKANNDHHTSSWFNNLDVEVMQKLIDNIIDVTRDKDDVKAGIAEQGEHAWFDEIMESSDVKLDDDADESLLASVSV